MSPSMGLQSTPSLSLCFLRYHSGQAEQALTKPSLVEVEEADNAEIGIWTVLHPLDVAPLNELEISWENVSKGRVSFESGNRAGQRTGTNRYVSAQADTRRQPGVGTSVSLPCRLRLPSFTSFMAKHGIFNFQSSIFNIPSIGVLRPLSQSPSRPVPNLNSPLPHRT